MKKCPWTKKFLSAKNDGFLTAYEASEDANKKMVVKEKLVLYDNRPADNIRKNDSFRNTMAVPAANLLDLLVFNSLQGFDGSTRILFSS